MRVIQFFLILSLLLDGCFASDEDDVLTPEEFLERKASLDGRRASVKGILNLGWGDNTVDCKEREYREGCVVLLGLYSRGMEAGEKVDHIWSRIAELQEYKDRCVIVRGEVDPSLSGEWGLVNGGLIDAEVIGVCPEDSKEGEDR